MKTWMIIAGVMLGLTVVGFLVASGPNTNYGYNPAIASAPPEEDVPEEAEVPAVEPEPEPEPEVIEIPDVGWDGEVYGHVHRVLINEEGDLLFFMEIKVDPSIHGKGFPSIRHENIQSQMDIYAIVELNGASSPRALMMENRGRSRFRIENEVKRFKEMIAHVESIVAMSETFILTNVTADIERKRFVADVAYVVAEQKHDLYESLFVDGFITSDNDANVDWGRRRP